MTYLFTKQVDIWIKFLDDHMGDKKFSKSKRRHLASFLSACKQAYEEEHNMLWKEIERQKLMNLKLVLENEKWRNSVLHIEALDKDFVLIDPDGKVLRVFQVNPEEIPNDKSD